MNSRYWNLGIALLFLAASVFALAWWIPNDVETGVIVKERRSIVVGDAMAPTMVAIGILIVSLALGLGALLRRSVRREDDIVEYTIGLTSENIMSVATAAGILIVSLACMVWAGPVTVNALQALGAEVPDYRLLIDTVPYKYIGFALGGFILVAGLIAWIEGRVRPRALLTAVAAVVMLIVVYDVPFDTLLLPPNGSQ